jgi:ribonuclease Z
VHYPIHECFITVDDLPSIVAFPKKFAISVGTQIHMSAGAFASVMKTIEPRIAIVLHFFNDMSTAPGICRGILSICHGPVSLARDLMVWNMTPEKITT